MKKITRSISLKIKKQCHPERNEVKSKGLPKIVRVESSRHYTKTFSSRFRRFIDSAPKALGTMLRMTSTLFTKKFKINNHTL